MSHQQIDDNGNAIPILRRRDGMAHNVTVAAGGVQLIQFQPKTALIAATKTVSFWAEGTVHVAFGGADIVATAFDHALPAGVIDYEPLTDNNGKIIRTHMSIYTAVETIIHISERD